METLTIENVRKIRKGPGGEEIEILSGISLRARAGELLTVIGPSGGGKSTLVRLINRLEDPTDGRILLKGKDVLTLDPLELRRKVTLVQQKPFMFEGTVLDNLQIPFHFRGQTPPDRDDPTLRESLELWRISPDFLDRSARTLSLGQQQRVGLARILIGSPEVLLLDEPTSALDRPTGDRLADTLREICRSRNLTLLMVTHDLRLAERVSDRLAFLSDGLILEEGDAADLLNRPRHSRLRDFLAMPQAEAEI